jgi:hypothetical protein
MTVLSHIYSALTQFRSQKIATFNLEQVVDDFLESPMCKTVEDNLYDNWTKHNKFYYTKGVDGNSLPGVDAITACYIFLTGSIWAGNYKLLTLIAKNLDPGVMTPTEFIKTNLVKDGNRLNVKIETLAGFE